MSSKDLSRQMNADRICGHCGKEFRFPALLRRHLESKRKCVPAFHGEPPDPSKQYICRFCGMGFKEATHRNRHLRVACKIAPNEKNGDAGLERLYAHTVQKQLADQKAEMAEMKAMMRQLLAQRPPGGATSSTATQLAGEVAVQGHNVQVDNSKKIVIHVFGQEKLDHVTSERVKAILDECLRRPALPTAADEAVLKTALLAYSDPERPENLTAYLPNKKTDDALVHTEAGWEVQPTRLVLPPMALKSLDALFGQQPPEGEYAPLLKELQQNEARFAAGEELRPLLVRNKDLLARALATLPVAGGR